MAFLALSMSTLVLAQGFPNKPIHIIVPFSPSSTIDIIARIVSPKLHEVMGQPVIVENRAGAGGMIGMDAAAKASPDGYTFVIAGVGQLAMSPPLYAKPPFDPLKDFAAVSLLATGPLVIAVHPGVPARSVKQLVDLAKKKPGQLNFGSAGVGTSTHVTGELFKILTGTNIVHIPYKGNAEAVTDLIGGQLSIVFTSPSTVVSMVKAGKVRLLATTGRRRIVDLPDVPTIAEAGVPDAQVLIWYGAVAPTATPRDVVAILTNQSVV
jgi:tripartite-type tricarboxylate transporter receptor subunit TctC